MNKNEVALNILISMMDHNQFVSISADDDNIETSKKFAEMYNAIYETLRIEDK